MRVSRDALSLLYYAPPSLGTGGDFFAGLGDALQQRVGVFFDYQNVHGWARRCFLDNAADPADGHIHPLAAAQLLVRRRKFAGALERACVYRGRPNPSKQEGAARANDRQASEWGRSPLIQLTRRNLAYPRGWPGIPPAEKGIDVAIAVDMLRMAIADEIDVAILFSSDNDLLPALEAVRDHTDCHVEVAAWTGSNRLRFDGTQTPYCHYLGQSDFESVRDHTDYAAR
ncbi:hypothetical protein GCM10027055_07960 [Janibacter alkaliphilus]